MATFAVPKRKKVQRLVKFICSMLLLMLATTMAERQETTEPQEAMPKMHISCYTDAKQSATERTMAHLFAERLAVPAYAMGELPGYLPTYPKPKCLQGNLRMGYNTSHLHEGTSIHSQQTPIFHHVIDYYIYTLEHILL